MNDHPPNSFTPPEITELPRGITTSPITTDWLVVVGVCLVVGVIAVLWVKFGRRRRRHHRHHHEHSHDQSATPETAEAPSSATPGQRKRRRKWGKRNPTLAQTGGLPPLREDSPAESPQNN